MPQVGAVGDTIDILREGPQKLRPAELASQPFAGALLALDVHVTGLPHTRYAG